jgi:hypothetical protein
MTMQKNKRAETKSSLKKEKGCGRKSAAHKPLKDIDHLDLALPKLLL